MKKFKKLILLGIVTVILGIFWLTSGITENLLKNELTSQIQAYNHNPSNILENVFEKDGQTILPFIFENSDQKITKGRVVEQFEKAGLKIENESELRDIIVTGDIIKTNSKIYTVIIYGDVNRDGVVDAFDAKAVLMHYVHGGQYILTGIYQIAANVSNDDNEIDAFDAGRILKFYVGLESRLVINEPESQKKPEQPEKPIKPEYNVPTGLKATYGDTLKNVELPTGFTFEDELTTKVGNAGVNKFKVTYTPEDTNKYEIVTGIEVEITVAKAIPEYTAPTGLKATYGDTLKDIKLPERFTFQDALTTSVGKVGVNKFKITYTPVDTNNYEIVRDIEIPIIVEEKEPVEKEDPEYEVPTGLTAVYGDTLKDVKLPTGFTFEDASTTKVGNVGINIFNVTYTPADTDKYNIITGIKVEIEVQKAKPQYTIPTGIKAYCGETLQDVEPRLPKGFSFQDVLTTPVGEIGNRKFKVIYTPDDIKNYEIVKDIEITILVDKTKPQYTVPTGLKATYGQTLQDVNLPSGFTFEDALTTPVGNAGDNTFKVTYTPTDNNYATVTGIDVIITVGKIDITLEKEQKDKYIIYTNHKITATLGQNVKNISNLQWEITDENGAKVDKSVAEIKPISSNNGIFEVNFIAKESQKVYIITPIVGDKKENANVTPITISAEDDDTISSIKLTQTVDNTVNTVNKIEINKKQIKILDIHYYHDYGQDEQGNKIEKEITTGVTGTLTVTPTPTENPTSNDNIQVILQNENGATINQNSQEAKSIWLKGLKETTTDIYLKISVDGVEMVNIPVTVKPEAPKHLELKPQTEPTKLYFETPSAQDETIHIDGNDVYTLIEANLTSEDIENIPLTKQDVDSMKLMVPGVEEKYLKALITLKAYKEDKTLPNSDAEDIKYIGIKLSSLPLKIMSEENVTKFMQANKITITCEGLTTPGKDLNISIQEKTLSTVKATLNEAGQNYNCYDNVGLKLTSGPAERKITNNDSIKWKIIKQTTTEDIEILNDTAKVTVGNIQNGKVEANFMATRTGTYKVTPIITTVEGKTVTGNTITITVGDLTIDTMTASKTTVTIREKETDTISLSFKNSGIDTPIDVERKRVTITPTTVENVQILLLNKEGIEITSQTQEVDSIYLKGLKQTTTPIELKISVDGRELGTITINVDEEAPKKFIKGNLTEPLTFNTSNADEIVYIPLLLESIDGTTTKLTSEEIANNITIQLKGSSNESIDISASKLKAIFTKNAYDENHSIINPSEVTDDGAEYMGIKVSQIAMKLLKQEEVEKFKSATKMTLTCTNTQGEVELNIIIK